MLARIEGYGHDLNLLFSASMKILFGFGSFEELASNSQKYGIFSYDLVRGEAGLDIPGN